MRRITILLFIAIITFIIILYVKRPDLVNHTWLWVVGLAAPVIGVVKRLSAIIEQWFREKIQHNPTKPAPGSTVVKNH
jgi:hypothetical protein